MEVVCPSGDDQTGILKRDNLTSAQESTNENTCDSYVAWYSECFHADLYSDYVESSVIV
jgi:hypothetical protein